MRWRALAVVALVLAACSSDSKPSSAGSTSNTASSAAETTTTTAVTTTAPPTTASPLAPIDGCPGPGPLAAPDPNRPRYVATATTDVTSGNVEGNVRITFTPDLPVTELVLRLWANAPALASVGIDEGIGDVTRSDGAVLRVDRPDATTAIAQLPEPLAAGSSITFNVPFFLQVPANSEDRIGHLNDTLRLGSFLPLLPWEPGAGWALDPPTTVHGEAATSPAADYDVTLQVPDGYDVLGTGERGADGRWRATAVRDVAYSIGHFTLAEADVGGVHITLGVDQSVGEDPGRYLDLIVSSFENYPARFGAYPWPTYTAAVLPGFSGGIEFPTHVMHGAGSTTRSIVHEVAHQWFYALVGNDQGRDPWLDEGLASYVEFVQVGSLAARKNQQIPSDAAGRTGAPTTFWDGHESSYFAGVYVQGGVAVANLGTVDEVDCALRHFVARNAFGIATPPSFFDAVATVFPDAVDRLAPYGLHP